MTFPADRRWKWAVLVTWIVILGAAGPFSGKFDKGQKNEQSSFLPGQAESVGALDQTKRFASGNNALAVIVYRDPAGLKQADLQKLSGDQAALTAERPVATGVFTGPILSRDRKTALLVAPVTRHGQSDLLVKAVDAMRSGAYANLPPGLVAKATGPAGLSRDVIKVFQGINGTLLLASGCSSSSC